MQTIDLKRIMDTANLKTKDLAPLLFPGFKHPERSVRSVQKGILKLNSDQLAELSKLLNVPVGLLFDDAAWCMSAPASENRIINFRSYDYFAELDLDTMTTTVSRNGMLFPEKITHPDGVGLHDYLSSLTDLIIKYKQK